MASGSCCHISGSWQAGISSCSCSLALMQFVASLAGFNLTKKKSKLFAQFEPSFSSPLSLSLVSPLVHQFICILCKPQNLTAACQLRLLLLLLLLPSLATTATSAQLQLRLRSRLRLDSLTKLREQKQLGKSYEWKEAAGASALSTIKSYFLLLLLLCPFLLLLLLSFCSYVDSMLALTFMPSASQLHPHAHIISTYVLCCTPNSPSLPQSQLYYPPI